MYTHIAYSNGIRGEHIVGVDGQGSVTALASPLVPGTKYATMVALADQYDCKIRRPVTDDEILP